MMSFVRNVPRFRQMLTPFPHHFHHRIHHHHRFPGNGQLTSTSIVQSIRIQRYSTGDGMDNTESTDNHESTDNTECPGTTSRTDELSDLTNRVTKLEKSCSSEIQDGFTKLRAELMSSVDKSLEKSLQPTNDAIKDARWWNRWILGTLIMGVLLKTIFYDRYTEEKLLKKIEDSESKLGTTIRDSENRLTKMGEDSESRLTKMVGEALSKFKLELKVAEFEKEKMSDQDKKKR